MSEYKENDYKIFNCPDCPWDDFEEKITTYTDGTKEMRELCYLYGPNSPAFCWKDDMSCPYGITREEYEEEMKHAMRYATKIARNYRIIRELEKNHKE